MLVYTFISISNIIKFRVNVSYIFKFQIYLNTHRKLFKLSKNATGTCENYLTLVKPKFLFWLWYGYRYKGKKLQQRSYSYLQEMFQLFEKHCIYPFPICIAIFHVISVWKLLTSTKIMATRNESVTKEVLYMIGTEWAVLKYKQAAG